MISVKLTRIGMTSDNAVQSLLTDSLVSLTRKAVLSWLMKIELEVEKLCRQSSKSRV